MVELEKLSDNLSRYMEFWVKKAHGDVRMNVTNPGNPKKKPTNAQLSDVRDIQDALNQEHIEDEWGQTECAAIGDTIPVEMLKTGVISPLPLPLLSIKGIRK